MKALPFLSRCLWLAAFALSSFNGFAGQGPDLDDRVAGDTDFALTLYNELARKPGNVFFSPYSISSALTMTYAGARGNTATQLATALRLTGPAGEIHAAAAALRERMEAVQRHGRVELLVANSLWPQKGQPFRRDYFDLVRERYRAPITPVDFVSAPEAACRQINQWVEDRTRRRIRDLVSPQGLSVDTKLIVASAIYFKGRWEAQFEKSATQPMGFHVATGGTVEVPFMHRRGRYDYAEDDAVQVLALPYAGDDLSLLIVLPRHPQGLAALERTLTREQLVRWVHQLARKDVEVWMPRYSFTAEVRLRPHLQAMGVVDAFNVERADFSGMDGQRHNLCLGDVFHKAFVEVNEEGTEAAAATAAGIFRIGLARPEQLYVFRADRPFVFLIVDDHTGSVLFWGRLANPKA